MTTIGSAPIDVWVARGVLAALGALCAIAVIVPAGLGWDFANFYDAGRKILAGQIGDLYDVTAWIAGAPPQGEMLFLSAPISAYLYAPMGLLPPHAALIAFKLQNVAAIAFALWLMHRRLAPLAGDDAARARFTALFLVMAALYQPLWSVFRVGGQTTPTVLVLLTAAALCHARANFAASAALLMAAGLIKPVLAPGLIFIGLVSGWRFFWIAAGYGAVVATASFALMGPDIQFEFLRQVASASQEHWLPEYNSALTAGLDTLLRGDASGAAPHTTASFALQIVARLFAVGLAVWLWRGAQSGIAGDGERRLFAVLVGVLLALTFSNVLWEHYLSYIFILYAMVAATRRQFPRPALALIAAIIVLSIGQNVVLVMAARSVFGFDTQLEQTLIAQFKSLPLLITTIFVLAYRQQLYAALSMPGWRAA